MGEFWGCHKGSSKGSLSFNKRSFKGSFKGIGFLANWRGLEASNEGFFKGSRRGVLGGFVVPLGFRVKSFNSVNK